MSLSPILPHTCYLAAATSMGSYTLAADSATRAILILTWAAFNILLIVWAFVFSTFAVHLFYPFVTV